MGNFGWKPDDVVLMIDSGVPVVSDTLTFFASRSDASTPINAIGTTSVNNGRWTYTNNSYTQLWVRASNNTIWLVSDDTTVPAAVNNALATLDVVTGSDNRAWQNIPSWSSNLFGHYNPSTGRWADDTIGPDGHRLPDNVTYEIAKYGLQTASGVNAILTSGDYLAGSDNRAWQNIPSWSANIFGGYNPVTGRWHDSTIGPDGHWLPENVSAAFARQGYGRCTASWPLTIPGGSNFQDTATDTTCRYPVRISFQSNRFRLHAKMGTDRDSVYATGPVSINGLWFGRANRSASTGLTDGTFAAASNQISGSFKVNLSRGAEYVSDWLTLPETVTPGVEYLLSLGYTTAAQTNYTCIGYGWRTTSSADASTQAPSGLAEQVVMPFDLWLEWDAPSIGAVGWFGDSLFAGTSPGGSGDRPVIDSVWALASIATGTAPVVYAAHGSTLEMWGSPTFAMWKRYIGCVAPSLQVVELGCNTIFNNPSMDQPTYAGLYGTYLATLRARTGCDVVISSTTLPRKSPATNLSGNTTTQTMNNWLKTLPLGISQVTDSWALFADTSTGAMQSGITSGDGVHLKRQQLAQWAALFTQTINHVRASGRKL